MTTRQYKSNFTSTVRTLAKDIADQLVATGKWDKIVDNTHAQGANPSMANFVIISPKQTYRFRTVNGNTVDNWAGASPRYVLAMAEGAERVYYKFSPVYNASNLMLGWSLQISNQMNAGNTDIYGTTAQIQAGGIFDYKFSDNTANSVATWGTTNTYYHKVACTKQLLSPVNTNYIYHDLLTPYTTFVDQESVVRFWIVAGTDDTPTLANSKDKEDWAMLTVQGLTGTSNTIASTLFGICKSNQLWHNYSGVVRACIYSYQNSLLWHAQQAWPITLLVTPAVNFANSAYFQDPNNLLNGYNYRQSDISFLNSANANNRLWHTSQYPTLSSSANYYIFLEDAPYSIAKFALDIFKNTFISNTYTYFNFYRVGDNSLVYASLNSNYSIWGKNSYFILPEDLLFFTHQGTQTIQTTTNGGDYVTIEWKKYIWVKNAGYNTAQAYYTNSFLVDANGF